MARHAEIHHVSPTMLPVIHQVSDTAPWQWLARGWEDFTKAPAVSLGYGFFVTAVMSALFLLLQSLNAYYLAAALMAGFVFIGPVMAVGLYEVSRRIEAGKPVMLPDSARGWTRNSGSVLGVGVVLVLLMLTWMMLSNQLVAVFYGIGADLGAFMGTATDWSTFLLSIQWPILLGYGIVGLLTAAVAFTLTVISLPMLTDKEDMDVISAISTSVQGVRQNARTMVLWAALIAGFTLIGVLPIFLGLVVVYPLLAYASWHAYRDLIGRD